MSDYPSNYELLNDESTKFLNVVVEIEGIPTLYSTVATYKKIRYGDPGLYYGEPGIVYGGLRQMDNVKPYLSINTSMVIQQRIEPEQGRGSVATFSLEFVDFNGEITNLSSPGQQVNQMLGGKLVKIYLGFQQSSFKEDYFVIFRGYVTSITCAPTKVIWQLSDANLKRRQQCFYLGKSLIDAPIQTFQPTDVNISTNVITVPTHGYSRDFKVTFGSAGVLPGGIDFSTEYFIVNPTTNTFQISNAYAGTPIDLTSQGTGTHQVQLTKIVGLQTHDFSSSNVNTVSDTIVISQHGYTNATQLTFTTLGILPVPLQVGTVYYVLNINVDTISLSNTPSGPALDLTTTGAGTHTASISGAPQATVKIPIQNTAGFTEPVLGPDGTYDPSLKTYLHIGNEYMEYVAGSLTPLTITASRGSRSTIPVEFSAGDDVANEVEIQGNVIDLALKIMLSGFGAPSQTAIALEAFENTGIIAIGNLPKAIILPDNIDAIDDYGLSRGDYLYITGSTSNDGTYTVNSFDTLSGFPNKIIYVNETLVPERPTAGLMAIRSQYDTFPDLCSVQMNTYDIDVQRWQQIKQFFLFQTINQMRILINSPEVAKTLIEKELLLPVGAYTITRFGKLSVTITKPPIADDRLTVLDQSNILEPQSISVNMSLNQRRFFNEVQYEYDLQDDGTFANKIDRLDVDSLNAFDTSSVLPISSRGIKTDLGGDQLIAKRGDYILKRYKDAAVELQMKVNFKAASQIEVGDVVPLYDNGTLQISNLSTGKRDLGAQLFEVTERNIDIKSGTAMLKLLTQIGYQIDDRFATISPSTTIIAGSTVDTLYFEDSYGALYPNNEKKKWEPFLGETIIIHSPDYSVIYSRTLDGFDPGNPYHMLISPSLPSPPPAGYIIEVDTYPDTTLAGDDQKYKLIFAFIDPTLTVVSGASTTQFDVSAPDAAKMQPGLAILIHNDDYSILSSEAKVDTIIGTTVTLLTAIEFVPAAGQKVELVGFHDGSGPFRVL